MSFTNERPITPRSIPPQFLTEYHKCYNTFNKSNNFSFRDKIQKSFVHPKYANINNKYRSNSYGTFLKSSAPFNYYNNNTDNIFICYNGGPKKQYKHSTNPSKYLKKSISSSLKYKKPCGCYSNYNISKYSQCFEPSYNYNTFYQEQELPMINRNNNISNSNEYYMNKFNIPLIKNRNGKISYKLKENIEIFKKEERKNTEPNPEEIEIKNRDKNKEINKEKNMNDEFTKNYFNLKPRKRFHKTQILNNYKPFLVDDFKDYGDYE